MYTRDAFAEKFHQLLREVPETYNLRQWQLDYRQVIYQMGLRILERFPEGVAGGAPQQPQLQQQPQGNPLQPASPVHPGPRADGHTGGPGSGVDPSVYIALAALNMHIPPKN